MLDWYRFILAKRARSKYAPFLAGYKNVLGVVASRTRLQGNASMKPEVCLRIYLKSYKRSPSALLTPKEFSEAFDAWELHGSRLHRFTYQVLNMLIPEKLGSVKTDIVCLPEGFKIRTLRKTEASVRSAHAEGLSGIDSKEYDYVGAGMAVSGQSIHVMQSFGSSAWPVVDSQGRVCITSNGHVSEKKGEAFYQANKKIGTNVGTIYPPDLYPKVAPADFCLAQVNADQIVNHEIVELGNYENDYHKPKVGMMMTKRGVTRYGSAGFVTKDAVVDGPFECGPVDYGSGKMGIVSNSYDIVAPSTKPHGGAGCSGSGENEVNGSTLLYPAGQLYAGGTDDQGNDHTIFYDWSASGGPIEKFGLRFNIDDVTPPQECPPGQHWDGTQCVPDEEEPPADDCFAKERACMVDADKIPDILNRFIAYLMCALQAVLCILGISKARQVFLSSLGSKTTKSKSFRNESIGIKVTVTIQKFTPKKATRR